MSTSWYALLYLEFRGGTHTVNVRFASDGNMIGSTLDGSSLLSATKLTVSRTMASLTVQEKAAAVKLKRKRFNQTSYPNFHVIEIKT